MESELPPPPITLRDYSSRTDLGGGNTHSTKPLNLLLGLVRLQNRSSHGGGAVVMVCPTNPCPKAVRAARRLIIVPLDSHWAPLRAKVWDNLSEARKGVDIMASAVGPRWVSLPL